MFGTETLHFMAFVYTYILLPALSLLFNAAQIIDIVEVRIENG